MSFFSDAELDSLKISNMILHVVGGDKFVEESEHHVEHDNFFLQRILDTNSDSVYSFNVHSDTKRSLEEIESGEETFEKAAQKLSRQFSGRHVGSSRDGAFFIFRLICNDPNTVFYTLIKYDYREAIERTDGKGSSVLRRIVNAFVSDKKAIQKSAIVRVTNGTAALEVSTRDRSLPPPSIVDYFEKFLDVTRTLSDEELNEKAFTAVQKVVVGIKQYLPEGKTAAAALGEVKAILRGRKHIGQKQLEEALHIVTGRPKDQAIVDSVIKILNKELRMARIFGLSFTPDKKKWATAAMRRVKTVEGITIFYRDDIKAIERKKDGDGEIITIKTTKISEDTIVSDTAAR